MKQFVKIYSVQHDILWVESEINRQLGGGGWKIKQIAISNSECISDSGILHSETTIVCVVFEEEEVKCRL